MPFGANTATCAPTRARRKPARIGTVCGPTRARQKPGRIRRFRAEFQKHAVEVSELAALTMLLQRARSRLYRSEIWQENMRLKALAEIYTMHSFVQLCNLNF